MTLPAHAIITVAELISRSHVPSGVLTTEFEELIGYVSQGLITACNRDYFITPSAVATELCDGDGTGVLRLRNWPVTATGLVVYSATQSETIGASHILTLNSNHKVNLLTGEVRRIDGAVFPAGFQNVQAIYKGGWAIASIPGGLKLAAIDWCIECFGRKDTGVTQEQRPEGQAGYIDAPMSKRVRALIQPYVNMTL